MSDAQVAPKCVTDDNASAAGIEQLYLSQYHTKIAPCPPKPNRSVPPDAETDMLISRSFPRPDANSEASATSSSHFRVELLNILHWTFAFIDGPPRHPCPVEAGHDGCHGLGTRSVALIIALP